MIEVINARGTGIHDETKAQIIRAFSASVERIQGVFGVSNLQGLLEQIGLRLMYDPTGIFVQNYGAYAWAERIILFNELDMDRAFDEFILLALDVEAGPPLGELPQGFNWSRVHVEWQQDGGKKDDFLTRAICLANVVLDQFELPAYSPEDIDAFYEAIFDRDGFDWLLDPLLAYGLDNEGWLEQLHERYVSLARQALASFRPQSSPYAYPDEFDQPTYWNLDWLKAHQLDIAKMVNVRARIIRKRLDASTLDTIHQEKRKDALEETDRMDWLDHLIFERDDAPLGDEHSEDGRVEKPSIKELEERVGLPLGSMEVSWRTSTDLITDSGGCQEYIHVYNGVVTIPFHRLYPQDEIAYPSGGTSLDELDLTGRETNPLKRGGIYTVEELVETMGEYKLHKIEGVGSGLIFDRIIEAVKGWDNPIGHSEDVKVGRFRLLKPEHWTAHTDGYTPYDIYDEWSGHLKEYHYVLFGGGREKIDIKESILELAGDAPMGTCVVIIDELELMPAYRDRNVGLVVLRRIMELFADLASIFATYVVPAQVYSDEQYLRKLRLPQLDDPKEIETVREKLRCQFRCLGLRSIPGHENYMVRASGLKLPNVEELLGLNALTSRQDDSG